MKILVINPGSTSTKLAIYEDRELLWKHTIHHSVDELRQFAMINDQLPMRLEAIREALAADGYAVDFDGVIGRGGLLKPTPGGVYEVTDLMRHDLLNAELQHACNLGGVLAEDIADMCGARSFIADPEVVDELMPEARLTGLKGVARRSVFHALNSKAVARRYAASIGKEYEALNLIVAHLGGGVSVSAHRHGKVVDVNNAISGEGPFSPERAGTISADDMVELCFSGRYTKKELKRMINGQGGVTSLLGTNDMRMALAEASESIEPAASVIKAMAYNIAKEIGARQVALRGDVDAIIFTGGISHSEYFLSLIESWISYVAPIVVSGAEDELDALAYNAYNALVGAVPISVYAPK
ncbi:MAG: butyrate kinase [Paramuribaculum sp.]|nr:butyrate kinase [Paramuribaculum sp.]